VDGGRSHRRGAGDASGVPQLNGEMKLGVRFRVGAAGAALAFPAGELLDTSPQIEDVWTDGGELAERVAEIGDPGGRSAC